MSDRPVVSILTDYGPHSEHVGALHAVLVDGCPNADRIDAAHDLPAGDILAAAVVLGRFVRLLPNAIHLAVVDPGVGTSRRPVAVRLSTGGVLIGPDNGLLRPAAAEYGATEAVALDPGRLRVSAPSATFHGRDVFAPAAAWIATGARLTSLGDPVNVEALVPLELPLPTSQAGVIEATVVALDRFGNVALHASAADLEAADIQVGDRVEVTIGERRLDAVVGHTFADAAPRSGLVSIDSHGLVAVSVNMGDAARRLGVHRSGAIAVLRSVAGVAESPPPHQHVSPY